MEAHLQVGTPRTRARSDVEPDVEHVGLTTGRLLVAGGIAGIVGGLAMGLTIVLWDWSNADHRTLELPMATTAWLFGLQHFSHDQSLWASIVLGSVLLLVYWLLSGFAYAALSDRVFMLASTTSLVVGGLIWGFVSYMFFWYFLIPIARDGEPFRLDVAPPWVWILSFTLLGIATGASYAAVRRAAISGRQAAAGGAGLRTPATRAA